MKLDIVRRPAAGNPDRLGDDLHPVLRRVYAGRGLCESLDLKLTLDRLLPWRGCRRPLLARYRLAQRRSGLDADYATSAGRALRPGMDVISCRIASSTATA
jgi:hypothetical protein